MVRQESCAGIGRCVCTPRGCLVRSPTHCVYLCASNRAAAGVGIIIIDASPGDLDCWDRGCPSSSSLETYRAAIFHHSQVLSVFNGHCTANLLTWSCNLR